MRKEKNNRKFKAVLLGILALFCTAFTGVSVWASTQQTLESSNSVTFTAHAQVGCDVTVYYNEVQVGTETFDEHNTTRIDSKTLVLPDIIHDGNETEDAHGVTDSYWKYLNDTDLNEYLEIKFEFKNTSSISTNILTVVDNSVVVPSANCTLATVDKSALSSIAQNSTGAVIYRFDVDGTYDVAEFDCTWEFVLTAER